MDLVSDSFVVPSVGSESFLEGSVDLVDLVEPGSVLSDGSDGSVASEEPDAVVPFSVLSVSFSLGGAMVFPSESVSTAEEEDVVVPVASVVPDFFEQPRMIRTTARIRAKAATTISVMIFLFFNMVCALQTVVIIFFLFQ